MVQSTWTLLRTDRSSGTPGDKSWGLGELLVGEHGYSSNWEYSAGLLWWGAEGGGGTEWGWIPLGGFPKKYVIYLLFNLLLDWLL